MRTLCWCHSSDDNDTVLLLQLSWQWHGAGIRRQRAATATVIWRSSRPQTSSSRETRHRHVTFITVSISIHGRMSTAANVNTHNLCSYQHTIQDKDVINKQTASGPALWSCKYVYYYVISLYGTGLLLVPFIWLYITYLGSTHYWWVCFLVSYDIAWVKQTDR